MSETKTVKTIRTFLFVYPDTRAGSPSNIVGERFEVSEDDGDSVERNSDGGFLFHVAVIKTILDRVPDGKGGFREVAKQIRTDRYRTVTVRPVYLWVEEESFEVPTGGPSGA
jgi:hypothetical protein